MIDFMKIIRERRSVRQYEERQIPEALLNQVLEAVRWSPSWANTQCWELIVVKNPDIKASLQKTMGRGNPATKAVGAAPVLIAVCGKKYSSGYYKDQVTTKFGDWILFDLGLATQCLCLAAHSLGLGTVITGLFDQNRAAEILKVPSGYELVSLIPMGYPAKAGSAPKRREIREFTHYDRF